MISDCVGSCNGVTAWRPPPRAACEALLWPCEALMCEICGWLDAERTV